MFQDYVLLLHKLLVVYSTMVQAATVLFAKLDLLQQPEFAVTAHQVVHTVHHQQHVQFAMLITYFQAVLVQPKQPVIQIQANSYSLD